MRRSTKLSGAFVSLLFLCAAYATIRACSGDFTDPEESYLFDPHVAGRDVDTSLFYTQKLFYPNSDYPADPDTSQEDRNLYEWAAYYQSDPKELNGLEKLLYRTDSAGVEAVFGAGRLPDSISQSLAARIRKDPSAQLARSYLLFAKRTEAFVNPPQEYYEPRRFDSAALWRLAQEAGTRYSDRLPGFFRERYAFQIVRAAYLSNHFETGLAAYKRGFLTIPGSSIGLRSMLYEARCLKEMGSLDEANALFAYVFAHAPNNRYSAYFAFEPMEDKGMPAALRFAKVLGAEDDLWTLNGIKGDALPAMKAIYAAHPKNPSLSLLLVRTVNQAEEQYLQNTDGAYPFFYAKYPDRVLSPLTTVAVEGDPRLKDFNAARDFIYQAAGKGNTYNPAAWNVAAAYLALMSRDLGMAERFMNAVKAPRSDSLYYSQVTILQAIYEVERANSIRDANQPRIVSLMQQVAAAPMEETRRAAALRYLSNNISNLYARAGDSVMQQIAYPEDRFFSSTGRAQQLIDFIARPGHTPLEQLLIARYTVTLDDLHYSKGVAYLYEYNFDSAAREFRQTKKGTGDTLLGNPFTIHIVDCHDCDHLAFQKTKYTPLSFADKMTELLAKGDSSRTPGERANNYFLYANGLYNLTWYGNNRDLHDATFNIPRYDLYRILRTSEYWLFDCMESMRYYQLARQYAPDAEFRARCTWMSAKCEHNKWLVDVRHDERYFYSYGEDTLPDFHAGIYFKELRERYANTKYYREALNECGYFCTYINRDDICIRGSK